MTTKKLLEKKGDEAILNPKPLTFEFRGESHPILPMPDKLVMLVADQLTTAGQVFKNFEALKTVTEWDEPQFGEDGQPLLDAEGNAVTVRMTSKHWTQNDLVLMVGPFAQILMPCSTEIIATSLRKDADWVNDNLFLKDRLRAMRLILEAEDIPGLMGELKAGANLFATLTGSPADEPTL